MPASTDIRAAGDRVETLLAELAALSDPATRAKAEELVTGMLGKPRFDLVAELTYPLPAYMIFTLIGFPPEDTELLKSWCGNRMAFSWGRPSVAGSETSRRAAPPAAPPAATRCAAAAVSTPAQRWRR